MSQQKNNFAENMKLAKIALIAAIVLAMCVIAPMKLSGKREKALDVFLNGASDEYRVSVYTDLKNVAENANRLANACQKEESADKESVEALKKSATTILTTDDPAEMLKAFNGISLYAENAYDSLNESAKANCKDAYVNLTDVSSVVKRDNYFSLASQFNKTRNAFPASLIAGVFGIDELPTAGK